MAVALYQAAAFYQGYQTSQEFEKVWGFVFPRGAKGWLWIVGLLLLAFLGVILQAGIYAAS